VEDGDKGGAAAIRGGGSSEEVSSIFFLAFFSLFVLVISFGGFGLKRKEDWGIFIVGVSCSESEVKERDSVVRGVLL